ncbi:MAG: DUF6452 family protein [Clostridium sp.]|nr:DUF6452 family protein [Clostridium sp.]
MQGQRTIRRWLPGALLAALAFGSGGCDTFDCPLNNTVYATLGFYAEQDGQWNAVTLQDSLTVTAGGTDSVLLNRQYNMNKIELPVSYTGKTDTLALRFSNADGLVTRDTIWLTKTNTEHYESPSCPSSMFHTITELRCTRRVIDTVRIVNPNIDYNGTENIQILFHSAD